MADNNADKEMLTHLLVDSITKVFKDALATIELSGLSPEQYKRVRRMILRSGNDEIRKVLDELNKYDVTYRPQYDEEISFD